MQYSPVAALHFPPLIVANLNKEIERYRERKRELGGGNVKDEENRGREIEREMERTWKMETKKERDRESTERTRKRHSERETI